MGYYFMYLHDCAAHLHCYLRYKVINHMATMAEGVEKLMGQKFIFS